MKPIFRSLFAAGLIVCHAGLLPAEALDEAIRKDFQAGFSGDQSAFDRAMKAAEETLAKNSKHAEAMVWHGAATFFLCGQAYQAGDMVKGAELWDKGLKEMADAVALEPENIGVLSIRTGTLMGAARHPMMPPDMGAQLLEVALPDNEKILGLHKDGFANLPAGYRAELLLNIAEGWDMLGKEDQARPYFERLARELPDSQQGKRAAAWIESKEKPAEK